MSEQTKSLLVLETLQNVVLLNATEVPPALEVNAAFLGCMAPAIHLWQTRLVLRIRHYRSGQGRGNGYEQGRGDGFASGCSLSKKLMQRETCSL